MFGCCLLEAYLFLNVGREGVGKCVCVCTHKCVSKLEEIEGVETAGDVLH